MSFYHSFQTTVTFANLIPFIQIPVHKFETIIQSSCEEGFDEDHFI